MEPIHSSRRLAYITIISLLLLTMCRSYKADPFVCLDRRGARGHA
jgi:hypothetical protein